MNDTGDTRHSQILRGILVQLTNRCWSWYLRVKKEDLRRLWLQLLNIKHLVIQSDLFRMVKWPFKWLSDLQLGNKKSRIESPGMWFSEDVATITWVHLGSIWLNSVRYAPQKFGHQWYFMANLPWL